MGILADKEETAAIPSAESIGLLHDKNSNSNSSSSTSDTAAAAAAAAAIEADLDEAIIPLKTQLMRLHWEEVIPKPPVPKAASKRGMKSSSVAAAAGGAGGEEELGSIADNSEYGFLFSEIQSWRDLADDGIISCSLPEALSAVLSSPLVIALHKIKSRIVDDDDGDLSNARMTILIQTTYSLICNKVDCGKSF